MKPIEKKCRAKKEITLLIMNILETQQQQTAQRRRFEFVDHLIFKKKKRLSPMCQSTLAKEFATYKI